MASALRAPAIRLLPLQPDFIGRRLQGYANPSGDDRGERTAPAQITLVKF